MIFFHGFSAIILWNMADVAWQEERPIWAYIYLFLSALFGTLVLSTVF